MPLGEFITTKTLGYIKSQEQSGSHPKDVWVKGTYCPYHADYVGIKCLSAWINSVHQNPEAILSTPKTWKIQNISLKNHTVSLSALSRWRLSLFQFLGDIKKIYPFNVLKKSDDFWPFGREPLFINSAGIGLIRRLTGARKEKKTQTSLKL